MHVPKSTPLLLLLSFPLSALSLSARAWPSWVSLAGPAPPAWRTRTDAPLPTPTHTHYSPITLPSSCKTACSAASTFWAGWADWDGSNNYASSWSNFCNNPSSSAAASSCASCYSSAWGTKTSADGWDWGWGDWGTPDPSGWCSAWSGSSGIAQTWTTTTTTTGANSAVITEVATVTRIVKADDVASGSGTASATGNGDGAALSGVSASASTAGATATAADTSDAVARGAGRLGMWVALGLSGVACVGLIL